jgi:hypothetical protein
MIGVTKNHFLDLQAYQRTSIHNLQAIKELDAQQTFDEINPQMLLLESILPAMFTRALASKSSAASTLRKTRLLQSL